MENEQQTLATDNEKVTEANLILNTAAAALRAIPGYGAAVVAGRKSNALSVIAPSGTQFSLKIK